MTRTLSHPRSNTASLSPAFAFAWLIWRRYHALFTAWLAYTTLLAAVVAGCPHAMDSIWGYIAGMPCISGLIAFIGIFADIDGTMLAAGTGYPRHFHVRPLRTTTLVFWPILYGSLACSLAWIACATFIFNPILIEGPTGKSADLLLSTLTIMGAVGWAQAIAWTRFRSNGLTGLALALPFVFVALLPLFGLARTPLILVTILWTAAAYATSWRGAVAARHGETRPATPANGIRRKGASRRRGVLPVFTSAGRAQTWFDARFNGDTMALTAVLTVVVMAVVHALVGIGLANVACATCLVLILMGAGPGIGAGSRGSLAKDSTFTTFYATRPLTCASLAASLIRASAAAVLLSSAVILVTAIIYEIIRSQVTGLLPLSPPALTPTGWLTIVAGLMLLSCKCRTDGQSALLSSRQGLVVLRFYAGLAVLLFPYMAIVYPGRFHAVLTALPALLGVAAVVKVIALAQIAVLLDRRRLLAGTTLAGIAAGWVIATAALTLLAVASVPASLASPVTVAAVVILIMPGVQTALLPLAIAWNRSR